MGVAVGVAVGVGVGVGVAVVVKSVRTSTLAVVEQSGLTPTTPTLKPLEATRLVKVWVVAVTGTSSPN